MASQSPDIPGCFSAGDTLDEAIENASEAIDGHLGILAEDGEDIPTAKSLEFYLEAATEDGAILCVIDVDMARYLGKAQKINITLPQRLISRIDDAVNSNPTYKSRSNFLSESALKELGIYATEGTINKLKRA